MSVMGFTKFERFFRSAGGVSVDRDDVTRCLDFVNDTIYELLLIGQATAKANIRDIIEPWDLPVTKSCRKARTRSSASRRRSSSDPCSNPSPPARPPLDDALSEATQARLPWLFGGISMALARIFKLPRDYQVEGCARIRQQEP